MFEEQYAQLAAFLHKHTRIMQEAFTEKDLYVDRRQDSTTVHKNLECSAVHFAVNTKKVQVVSFFEKETTVCRRCLPDEWHYVDSFTPLREMALRYLPRIFQTHGYSAPNLTTVELANERADFFEGIFYAFLALRLKVKNYTTATVEQKTLLDVFVVECTELCEKLLTTEATRVSSPWKQSGETGYLVVNLDAWYTSTHAQSTQFTSDVLAWDAMLLGHLLARPHSITDGFLVVNASGSEDRLIKLTGTNREYFYPEGVREAHFFTQQPTATVISTAKAFIKDGMDEKTAVLTALSL